MIVGLTGGIGAGKSEVSRRFEALGIKVVDADQVARDLVEPGSAILAEILEHFGDSLGNVDGTLNRAKLRSKIFSDANAKTWLENLLHPLIRRDIIAQLARCDSPYSILASPLLLDTSQYQLVDRVLVVDTEADLQVARVAARDQNSPAQIQKIMASQLSRAERCAKADDIIHNTSDLKDLDPQVHNLHRLYLSMVQPPQTLD